MANLNRYNEKREEMIEIRRKKAGLEEIQNEKREILVPTTLKGKWENFLYHYKKTMLAMMFVIILVTNPEGLAHANPSASVFPLKP